ncbi:nucleoside transporter C-terminal domain-containing protein [Candidatus Venteria ishoeyi]|uniref:NupC/NupG family nucleoside CNT transporter n=1 Tax=Candidatus Venteria ishoeyi TaxID=1899563 RepID=UPI0025A5B858|nr:nucleoside transporter C-terminal domain-containing protein [Candidatus Venteria ishoeyi]MDM8546285.1 nucleoside transporter C-terminal domain-containing protein [Candidatus Venteria ishoeyi]
MIWQSILGLLTFPLLAWALSENHRAVKLKTVAAGLLVQLILASVLLNLPFLQTVFSLLNDAVLALEAATRAGTSFIFGYVGGGETPFTTSAPHNSFILAFQALPLLLVVSALSALLFYWRILPWIVRGLSWGLQKTLNIGGALGLSTAANIFVGMTEAPLFIRPYLKELTRSELFTLMATGMATIAGTVLVVYANILRDVVPDIMGHLLIASVISAPAAIAIAQIIVPETKEPTAGALLPPQQAHSAMDAISKGTLDGIQLLINVIALLLVFVALVALINSLLALLPTINQEALTLQRILGWLMAPVVWLMGIPWSEAQAAGALMGVKTILNEFVAYLNMTQLPETALSERSRLIMAYALCGFANFGSLGIMIGGIGTMVPERRQEIVGLGLKSIIAGTLATCMTGALVGVFI